MNHKKLTLKEKIINNVLTLGSWITFSDPNVAEVMAQAGFDWLTIDMEHSALTIKDAQNLIRVIELYGIPPLVRVGDNDPVIIKRVMDAGAHGVVVPMVNNGEDAVRAVKAVKYPPRGTRGVGLARAQGYGVKFDEYKEWVEKESVVIVQIEHVDAINNLDEIFSVKEVDGFIVGPYDLSGSMGRPGDFKCPEMKDALKKIQETAQKYGKTAGFHSVPTDYHLAKEKIKAGYRFVAYSVDFLLLGDSIREGLSKIKEK